MISEEKGFKWISIGIGFPQNCITAHVKIQIALKSNLLSIELTSGFGDHGWFLGVIEKNKHNLFLHKS